MASQNKDPNNRNEENASDVHRTDDSEDSTKKNTLPCPLCILLGLFAFLLFVGGVWFWGTAEEWQEFLVILGIAGGLVGIFPLTYLAYASFGAQARRKRLRDDFQLLGLVSEENLDETIEHLYQNAYSWPQFMVYVGLIVAWTLLILAGYLNREYLSFVTFETMTLVFYSYLGAYVYSIQELVRRYNTFDLQPQVYSSIFVRMFIAVAITFVGASFIVINSSQFVGNSNLATDAIAWAAVLAFVIGLFPSSGIRWFVYQANRIFNPPSDQVSELSLRNLLGMSTWHEARFSMMGIDDAQNLATVDIPKLLLTTQFDTQQIVNWIDQAILYVKVGNRIDRFREAKITTFHEFQLVLDGLLVSSSENSTDPETPEPTKFRTNLSTLLGLTDPDELARLGDYSNFPNYTHIALYYQGTAVVGRQRGELGILKLTGVGVIDRTWTRALTATYQNRELKIVAQKIERQILPKSKDPQPFIDLGTIYYQLRKPNQAIKKYTKAIELIEAKLGEAGNKKTKRLLDLNFKLAEAFFGRSMAYIDNADYERAIDDCTKAINFNRGYAEAFNNRGLGYMEMGYYDQAVADLNEALRLDDRLAVAYHNRGITFNAQGEFKKATVEFEKAYLLSYLEPGLWFGWGKALIGIEQYGCALEKLTQALLLKPDWADAYANRGYAHLELGQNNYGQARRDFEKAIDIDDSLVVAHTNLGILEARQKNYVMAIPHYRKALELAPEYFVARSNLAIAYYEQGNLEDALNEFQHVIKSAPSDSFDYQQAEKYVSRLLEELTETLEHFKTSLESYRGLGNRRGEAVSLKHIGSFLERSGQLDEALINYQESLSIMRELEDKSGQAELVWSLGLIHEKMGDFPEAQEFLTEALTLYNGSSNAIRVNKDLERVRSKLTD